MITELGSSIFGGEFDNQSFKCDKCGVLIGTCMDFHFNDDYAVAEWKVEEMGMVCGRCRRNLI